MEYDGTMDMRKASKPPLPQAEHEWLDSPVTAADWAAMPEAERQAILEAEAELERGEWVDGEVVMAKLEAMVRKYQAKVAQLR